MSLAGDVVRESGRFTAFSIDVARATFRRPFQVRELVQQSWFVASVSILPTTLVAIPFGASTSVRRPMRRATSSPSTVLPAPGGITT